MGVALMLLQHPFISSFHKSAWDGRMPKNPGCFPSLHAMYDFCTKLSTKADKNLTNIFHFQGMAQQIKEKEKEILMCNKPWLWFLEIKDMVFSAIF